MKHHIGMMVACLLPMALIYSLPSLGIESGALLVLLLAGCVIIHLVMDEVPRFFPGKKQLTQLANEI